MVTISDHRILKVEETSVSFKTPGSGRLRTLTLDPLEFIRRFLQHVLLKGFMKVRYYGFLSPTAKPPLEDIKALIELAHGFTVTGPEIEPPPWPLPICQTCGGDYASIRCLAPDPLQGGGMGALPIEVAWEVAHDECFRRIARRGVTLARPEDAHSVHVEPTGLAVP